MDEEAPGEKLEFFFTNLSKNLDINFIRISFLYFVVYIHSYISIKSYFGYSSLFIDFFSTNFFPAAILAGLSGHLYFRSLQDFQINHEKYLRRIISVAKPYLSWSFIFWFIYWLIAKLSNIIGLTYLFSYTNHPEILEFRHLFSTILHPQNHLWYLHNLALMMVVGPIFFNDYARLATICLLPIIESIGFLSEISIVYRFIFFFLIGAQITLQPISKNFTTYGLLCLLLLVSHQLSNSWNLITVELQPLFFFIIYSIFMAKFFTGLKLEYNKNSNYLLYVLHPLIIIVLSKILQVVDLNRFLPVEFTNGIFFTLPILFVVACNWLIKILEWLIRTFFPYLNKLIF